MLVPLAALVFVLTALDHWTTWLCLSVQVDGWWVTEANPISDWLFAELGLVPGLALDSGVTLAALAFLLRTELLPTRAKGALLALLTCTTGYAVVNNLEAVRTLGLWPGLGS